jgi:hypothetical protein
MDHTKSSNKNPEWWLLHFQEISFPSIQELRKAIDQLKVPELRKKLKVIGLPSSGTKSKMTDLLLDHVDCSENPVEFWLKFIQEDNDPKSQV